MAGRTARYCSPAVELPQLLSVKIALIVGEKTRHFCAGFQMMFCVFREKSPGFRECGLMMQASKNIEDSPLHRLYMMLDAELFANKGCSRKIQAERSSAICEWQREWRGAAKVHRDHKLIGVGYDLAVGQAVYAIDDLPDDDLLWRIEWVGGVSFNASVPSDPLMNVCLAQLPAGETNPLSARARSFQTKRTARISVGLLPYISISSVWRRLVE